MSVVPTEKNRHSQNFSSLKHSSPLKAHSATTRADFTEVYKILVATYL